MAEMQAVSKLREPVNMGVSTLYPQRVPALHQARGQGQGYFEDTPPHQAILVCEPA